LRYGSGCAGFRVSKAGGHVLILSGLGVAALGIAQSGEVRLQAETANISTTELVAGRAIVDPELPDPRLPTPAALAASPVVVTLTWRKGEPPSRSERIPIPKHRDTLTRELQKELRRVGCYQGEINGVWSQSTRRGMKMFVERLNASLPIDEPDGVLYAMVKGQHKEVCGKACGAGEGLNEDGRCVPAVLLAKAKPKVGTAPLAVAAVERPTGVIIGWSSIVTPQSDVNSKSRDASKYGAPPFAARMGLAGPPKDAVPTTATQTPRARPTRATSTNPRIGPSGKQRWSAAIFNPRNSNN
jgi:hypothetical protein